jgi:hypothetical protein
MEGTSLTSHENTYVHLKHRFISSDSARMKKGVILPRFSIGMHLATIVKPPFTMPDPPMPATALPTMNIFDEVATPDRREPSSNRPRKAMKQILEELRHNFDMEVG